MNSPNGSIPIPQGIIGSLTQQGIEEYHDSEVEEELLTTSGRMVHLLRQLYKEGEISAQAYWQLTEELGW